MDVFVTILICTTYVQGHSVNCARFQTAHSQRYRRKHAPAKKQRNSNVASALMERRMVTFNFRCEVPPRLHDQVQPHPIDLDCALTCQLSLGPFLFRRSGTESISLLVAVQPWFERWRSERHDGTHEMTAIRTESTAAKRDSQCVSPGIVGLCSGRNSKSW